MQALNECNGEQAPKIMQKMKIQQTPMLETNAADLWS